VTSPESARAFVGQVQHLVAPAELSSDVAGLERAFTAFLERSRRMVLACRVALSAALAVGLAFVASRVDAPLPVGLCGALVLAPLVWLATAVLVPMALLGRAGLSDGAGFSMQAGVSIEVSDQGVSAGSLTVPWGAVTGVDDDGDALVVRGVDRPGRRVFRVVLAARSFSSLDDRRAVLAELRGRVKASRA
jgi:hypothetical protein